MSIDDNLKNQEIYELKNNEYKDLSNSKNINTNYKNNMDVIRYFEVLTDGYHFWVSIKDMENICTQISVSQLEEIGVKLDTDVVFGEAYINVNDEFLIYVQKNTNNPKYVPSIGLLATKSRDYDYENEGKQKIARALAQTVYGENGEEHIKTK